MSDERYTLEDALAFLDALNAQPRRGRPRKERELDGRRRHDWREWQRRIEEYQHAHGGSSRADAFASLLFLDYRNSPVPVERALARQVVALQRSNISERGLRPEAALREAQAYVLAGRVKTLNNMFPKRLRERDELVRSALAFLNALQADTDLLLDDWNEAPAE